MKNVVWLVLYSFKGIGVKKIKDIKSQFSDLKLEDLMNPDIVHQIGAIIGEKYSLRINDSDELQFHIDKTHNMVKQHHDAGITIITLFDDLYPSLLRTISNPPFVLYCKGNIDALKSDKKIAIIGTRKSSHKGQETAATYAGNLSKYGWTIVSGLAKGIDTAAHVGALKAEGITIAVLPGPLDNILPKSNHKLAEDIIKNNGLLITEYQLGTTMNKNYYIARDRIQSGLSLAVLVVQSDIKGGTMQTVEFAKEQNRMLLCPKAFESLDFEYNRGVELLIKEGVNCIDSEELGTIEDLINQYYYGTSLWKIINKSASINYIQESLALD